MFGITKAKRRSLLRKENAVERFQHNEEGDMIITVDSREVPGGLDQTTVSGRWQQRQELFSLNMFFENRAFEHFF